MPGTVVDSLRERARDFAARPALITAERTLAYAELFERVDRLSHALMALGLRPGDAMLAYLPNTPEAVECELAALGSGLPWVTLNARLTWAEVRGVLVACAPRLVVTDPAGLRKIEAGLPALPLSPLPPIVVTGERPPERALGYEALLAAHLPRRPSAAIDAEAVARLRYTSGTTGSAKAAVLPHRVYAASLRNLLHVLSPVTGADRALHVAPLTHGSGALLYPIFHEGGANVLEAHFDADRVLETVERHRVTTLFAVPTMLTRLVSAPSFDSRDLSSLRALIYGGAPMPAAQLDAACRKLGHALHQIYGMTEAPWPITVLGPVDHVPGSPRLRSVGRKTTVCTARIVGEGGVTLPPGEVGEIELRGENVMREYLGDPEGTRAVLRDGWLSTGDLGRFDEDGYLYIVGREKDVIISGGFNVYAAEVEAALSEHEAVLETAVVGLENDEWGELVAAAVVPRVGATLTVADVERHARGRLSGYKCPRRIELFADLPKNASGKIQKSDVKRLFG